MNIRSFYLAYTLRKSVAPGTGTIFILFKSNNMRNLKTKALQLGATDFLSREQLKNVLGGAASGCLALGEPCLEDIQCCPNCCVYEGGEYGVCVNADQCS